MLRHLIYLLLTINLLCATQGISQVYPIKVDQKWGLVDGKGKMVASPMYDAIHDLDGEHSVIVKNGKYGLLNSAGQQMIPPKYTFLRAMNADLILINQGGNCDAGECEGGKWGLIHLRNDNLIEPQFDLIGKFRTNGLALVNAGGDCDYLECEGGKWGMIDTLGQLRIAAEYKSINFANAGEAFVETADGWGMFNLVRGKMQISPIYGELQRVGPNRITMKAGDKYGVLTDQGDTLIAPRYDGIIDAEQGYLAYQDGRKFGLMDSVGKHHTTARFDKVIASEFGWVRIYNDGKWGLVDLQDHEIIGPVLRQIGKLGAGFATVQRGPLWGVLDKSGDFIIPDKYEELSVVNDSSFLVRDRKYHKWLNLDGQVTSALAFDEISDWQHNVAKVRVGKRWGIINRKGEWIAPARYEEVRIYELASKGRRNDRWEYFYFDEDGAPSKVKRLVLIKGEEEELEGRMFASNLQAAGWFYSNSKLSWGLRNPQTNRILLPPQFSSVEIVPGRNLTIAKGAIGEGPDEGWGLVDHVRGKILCEPLFAVIITADFGQGPTARATYGSSGRFALVSADGEIINFDKAAFIGDFSGDVARINLGGSLEWASSGGMDAVNRERIRDRRTQRMVWHYQYCRQGKWGFIDREGNWKCPAEYETLLDFDNGLARVRKGGKWGVMNTSFQLVVEAKYDFIENLYTKDGTTLMTVGMDRNEYGFIDEKGEIAILPRFSEVGAFHEGMVRVRKGTLWGFADRQGNVVIEPQFREAGDFHEGRARVRNKRYWGYIDKTGTPVTVERFLRAGDFVEGLAWVQAGKFFGYLGLQGELIIPAEFTEVGDFSEGLAPAKRKGSFGLIDNRGRWVVSPKFYRIHAFHDSLAVVQDGGNFGLVNPRGEFVVKPAYRQLGDFSEGLAAVREKLEFGYLNAAGEIQIPCQFANAGPFSGGLAPVFQNGKWGFVDTTGTFQVENRFSKVRGFHEGRAAVRVEGAWGFVDPRGRVAVPTIYNQVGDFEHGRAAVYLEADGWGFVNTDGTLVVPCRYEAIGEFRKGLVPVKSEGKWGLINQFGAPVTLLKYDEIRSYDEGMAPALLKRKVGVVNGQGKELVPLAYDTVKRVHDRIQVEAADAVGYIDLDGNWIWQPSK